MIQLKHDEDEAKKRVNAWWAGEIVDRPPIILTAPSRTYKSYEGPDTDELDEWWTNPDFVVPRLKHELLNTAWLGEAFPMVMPLSYRMVAVTCQYLGAPNQYVDKASTWSDHIIDDWSTREPFRFDPENIWWKKTMTLMDAVIKMIKEDELKAYIGGPDLNGPSEVLAGLRGQENFSMDFYDCPDEISKALREVQDAWFEIWERSSGKTHSLGGWFTWLKVWSDKPSVDLQSDVSCLLSKEMFDQYLLPFIVEQSERIENTVYHLDGPDAMRHLDSLLTIPNLKAVQWIQGAGNGPMVDWTDLLKKIQAGGKNLWIKCKTWEIEPILRELDPRGCLFITEASSEEEGEQVIDHITKNWRNW
jgi:hypothetical protein